MLARYRYINFSQMSMHVTIYYRLFTKYFPVKEFSFYFHVVSVVYLFSINL